ISLKVTATISSMLLASPPRSVRAPARSSPPAPDWQPHFATLLLPGDALPPSSAASTRTCRNADGQDRPSARGHASRLGSRSLVWANEAERRRGLAQRPVTSGAGGPLRPRGSSDRLLPR